MKKLRNVKENELKLSDLPRTKTSVITRKTTYIPVPKLNGKLSYESDTSTSNNSSSNVTMPLKRKQGRPRKESTVAETITRVRFRSCEECEDQVKPGVDMYRYHRSGRTVCRDCWLTMDPEKMANGKRKKLARSDPESGTKLCAVFLKDVLSNPSKYDNIYRVEKDKDGNTTFLITDESSESEEKDKVQPTRLRARATNSSAPTNLETVTEVRKAVKRSPPKESKVDHETVKKGRTRRSDESIEKESETELGPVEKGKPRRSDESVEISHVSTRTRRARNGLAVEVDSTIKTKSRRGSSESTSSTRLSPEIGKKSPPVKKITRSVRNVGVKKLSSDEKSHEGESSSNESQASSEKAKTTRDKKKEKVTLTKSRAQRAERRARSSSFTSSTITASVTILSDDNFSDESPKPLDAQKMKNLKKASKRRVQNAKSDSELDKPYTCSVCRLGCKNKLVGMAHELSHEKQPEVKLRRVVVSAAVALPETIVEETPLEVSAPAQEESEKLREEKEENTAVDVNCEQPNKSEEKSEAEEATVTSKKTVSEEKESSPVREEPNDDRTTERESDREEENKKEFHLSLEEEENKTVETDKLLNDDQPICRENQPDLNENEEIAASKNEEVAASKNEEIAASNNDEIAANKNEEIAANENEENAMNENKENAANEHKEDSEEKISEEKETIDKIEGCSAGAEELAENNVVESADAPTMAPTQIEPEKTIDVTPVKDSEEKTQSYEPETTPEDSEPMEVTETDEKEKNIEENENSNVKKLEKEVDDNEMGTKDDGSLERVDTELDCSTTKTASETKETPDVEKIIEEEETKQVPEKPNEEDEKKEEKEQTNESERTIDSKTAEDNEKEREVSPEVEKSTGDEESKESEKKEEETVETAEKVDETERKEERSNESSSIACACIREVFDLANAEVQKRLDNETSKEDPCTTLETLENISLEIQNGADMPSLEL
ncbi:myb-like protein X isoform X2 [Venturia canescens]|nr:myb-like protein X isoform X2 [Venturia canescens]